MQQGKLTDDTATNRPRRRAQTRRGWQLQILAEMDLPHDLRSSDDRPVTAVQLGSVLRAIDNRAGESGEYYRELKDLQHEAKLRSLRQTKRVVEVLRAKGWIESKTDKRPSGARRLSLRIVFQDLARLTELPLWKDSPSPAEPSAQPGNQVPGRALTQVPSGGTKCPGGHEPSAHVGTNQVPMRALQEALLDPLLDTDSDSESEAEAEAERVQSIKSPLPACEADPGLREVLDDLQFDDPFGRVEPLPPGRLNLGVFAPLESSHLRDLRSIVLWYRQQLGARSPVLGNSRADLLVVLAAAIAVCDLPTDQVTKSRPSIFAGTISKRAWTRVLPRLPEAINQLAQLLEQHPRMLADGDPFSAPERARRERQREAEPP